MASGNFSDSPSMDVANNNKLPSVDLLTMFRLGLFQMGLGIMSVLALGILNRVMIADLGIDATIAAGALAMHQFVAPVRVWFGQMSDAKPLFGYHRTGYVWTGAALFCIASFFAVQVMWQLGSAVNNAGGWTWTPQTYTWAALLALIFALYGLALSMSSTPFAALLVDVSEEENRSKLVGIVWSMLMVGIVVGAIVGGVLLNRVGADASIEQLQAAINNLFLIVPAIVFGLALIATWGVEKKYSLYTSRSSLVNREDKITLGKAVRVLTASRQTGIFFTFLLVMTVSLFMQEAVLEPYGGEVFNMSVGDTTKLNAFWGMGTLIGISSSGFLITPRIGKQKTAKFGCLAVAGCFIIIILSGFSQNPKLLQFALFLFGLASGITTNGAISLMLDLTAAETAGTFIGAWGLAQAMSRATATVTGGIVLDVGKKLFNSNLVLAYGLVFALQAVGMVLAVWCLSRVNVREFRDNTKSAIASVIETELD